MKGSAQQQYYATLVTGLASPFNLLPWEFSGFCSWYRGLIGIGPGIVPDAHYVSVDTCRLYLLEIVETHDIDEEKAKRLSYACWMVDEFGWDTDIVIFYPRHGRTVINQNGLLLDSMAVRLGTYRAAFTATTERAQP